MKARIKLSLFGDPGWLQWALTVPLLAAERFGSQKDALAFVVALCIVMTAYYWQRDRSPMSFPVQVRLGFLAFLALACAPGLDWLLWVPLAGTTLQVCCGYCPMARLLRLMPWNREMPLSANVAMGIFLAAPGDDGLFLGPTPRARGPFRPGTGSEAASTGRRSSPGPRPARGAR